MIRDCNAGDFDSILAVINDAARAYRGVIPADLLRDPYMSTEALRRGIADGVAFSGADLGGELLGAMGSQCWRT